MYSAGSSPSTQASLGIRWIQDSRLQPSLANERQARFAPSTGSVTTLPATVPWPPFNNSSNQCQPLPSIHVHSIALLGSQKSCSIIVWYGTRGSALGQPACIVMCVRHARHHTGPETSRILQQNPTINRRSPGLHLVFPFIYHLSPFNLLF